MPAKLIATAEGVTSRWICHREVAYCSSSAVSGRGWGLADVVVAARCVVLGRNSCCQASATSPARTATVLANRIGRGPGTPIVRMVSLPGERAYRRWTLRPPSWAGQHADFAGLACLAAHTAREAGSRRRSTSTRLPAWIIAEEATIGEANVVDEKQSEREADQARCDPQLPIEPRQIDRREREWGDQQQRDHHHAADGADAKEKQVGHRQHGLADDRYHQQGNGGRTGQSMQQSDRKWPQPLIEWQTAEPAAVECRQRRLFVGMTVIFWPMPMRMPMHIIAVAVHVVVPPLAPAG